MRLDHLSYAAPTNHLADVVQRLGSRLGAGFTDGGVHPRFGTRNFVLPLAGGAYLEVVAALDHPAADSAPFGRAVKQRAVDGGGWLGWVVEVPEMATVESRLGREAGRRPPPSPGRLRPALEADRRQRAARRPAAAVLHPLGVRARAAPRLRQRHRDPHHQARDRRRLRRRQRLARRAQRRPARRRRGRVGHPDRRRRRPRGRALRDAATASSASTDAVASSPARSAPRTRTEATLNARHQITTDAPPGRQPSTEPRDRVLLVALVALERAEVDAVLDV